MKATKAIVGVAIGSASFFFVYSAPKDEPPPDEAMNSRLPRQGMTTNASQPIATSRKEEKSRAYHPSLRDTQVAGGVTIRHQKVQPDLKLKQLFDYFTSLRHLASQAVIQEALKEHLERTLPQQFHQEVLRIFQAYQSLLDQESTLLNQPQASQDLEGLRDLILQRRDLRREVLPTEVADAFYDHEERYEEFQWQLALQNPESMPPENHLSREQQDRRQKTFAYAKFKASPSQPTDLDHIAETFGEEALQRLEEARKQQAAWQEKRQNYQRIRDSLLTDQPFNHRLFMTALQDETADFLSPQEFKRMQILDELEAESH